MSPFQIDHFSKFSSNKIKNLPTISDSVKEKRPDPELDPDLHSDFRLDPDPYKTNIDNFTSIYVSFIRIPGIQAYNNITGIRSHLQNRGGLLEDGLGRDHRGGRQRYLGIIPAALPYRVTPLSADARETLHKIENCLNNDQERVKLD